MSSSGFKRDYMWSYKTQLLTFIFYISALAGSCFYASECSSDVSSPPSLYVVRFCISSLSLHSWENKHKHIQNGQWGGKKANYTETLKTLDQRALKIKFCLSTLSRQISEMSHLHPVPLPCTQNTRSVISGQHREAEPGPGWRRLAAVPGRARAPGAAPLRRAQPSAETSAGGQAGTDGQGGGEERGQSRGKQPRRREGPCAVPGGRASSEKRCPGETFPSRPARDCSGPGGRDGLRQRDPRTQRDGGGRGVGGRGAGEGRAGCGARGLAGALAMPGWGTGTPPGAGLLGFYCCLSACIPRRVPGQSVRTAPGSYTCLRALLPGTRSRLAVPAGPWDRYTRRISRYKTRRNYWNGCACIVNFHAVRKMKPRIPSFFLLSCQNIPHILPWKYSFRILFKYKACLQSMPLIWKKQTGKRVSFIWFWKGLNSKGSSYSSLSRCHTETAVLNPLLCHW